MSKLSIHLIPAHNRTRDMDLIARIQPPVIKVVDPDSQKVADLYKIAPNALFVLRDFPRSDQHQDMLNDPSGTGRRHASETLAQYHTWLARGLTLPPADRLIWLGINEPEVWINLGAVVAYYVAFLDGLTAVGLRGGALNLSVGWPANTGPGTPPDWAPYQPVCDAIQRGHHYLVLHEYWNHEGPDVGRGWYAERYKACSWRVPLIVGECGLDEFTTAPGVGQQKRGWKGWLTPEQYMAQLVRYDEMVNQDSRIVGACVFTSDFGGREWFSFDTEGLEAFWPVQATGNQGPEIGEWGPEPSANAVTVDGANVRARPALSGDVVTTLSNGQRIHLVGEATFADGLMWLAIDSPTHGYIARSAPNGAPIVKLDSIALRLPFPGSFPISQPFGGNASAYARFGLQGHNGIDFALPEGTPVLAADVGQVVEVQNDPGGFGLYVKLRHAWGESLYAHLSVQQVNEGQQVAQGQPLGLSGNTGNSTGPHLHFGLRITPYDRADGWQGYTDPQPYF